MRFKIGEPIVITVAISSLNPATGAMTPVVDASGWTVRAQARRPEQTAGAPAFSFAPTFISGNLWQLTAMTGAVREPGVVVVDVRCTPPGGAGDVISDTYEIELERPVTR